MQLFTNMTSENFFTLILPYVNITLDSENWSTDKTKEFFKNLKQFYYIAPFINNQGDECRNAVYSISLLLDGNVNEQTQSFYGRMHVVDDGGLFYDDFEMFKAFLPVYLDKSTSCDSTKYLKIFDNETEAKEALCKWNEESKSIEKEPKIRLAYKRLIMEKESIERKIDDMKKTYTYLK